jgi:hypothetical protein
VLVKVGWEGYNLELFFTDTPLFERRPELEHIVQLAKVAIIRQQVCPDLYRLSAMLHEVICLANRQFGSQSVIWVPLCLCASRQHFAYKRIPHLRK